MKRRNNRLKEVLSRGEVALGTCLYSFSPALMEVAGYAGLVWCRVDNEHAWRQDFHTESLLRAAAYVDVTPLLRVDRDNPSLVRKGLEAGAGGIIVPHIRNAKEAEEIVRAAKFPPLGDRGYGSLCFSGGWGLAGGEEWIRWCNEETLVIPMIERVEAVENIDSIVSVEGVDGVFFGGSDYSITIGLAPQPDHPRVYDALQKTVDAARKREKFVICGASYPWRENVQRLREMGVQAIEIGHDVSILGTIWKKTSQEVLADEYQSS